MDDPNAENNPDTPIAGRWEGPCPQIAARTKPANSLMARGAVEANQFDGPFGGKKPQS